MTAGFDSWGRKRRSQKGGSKHKKRRRFRSANEKQMDQNFRDVREPRYTKQESKILARKRWQSNKSDKKVSHTARAGAVMVKEMKSTFEGWRMW